MPKRQSIIEKIENIETKITPITTVGFSKPEKTLIREALKSQGEGVHQKLTNVNFFALFYEGFPKTYNELDIAELFLHT